jgi:hypothetical protein
MLKCILSHGQVPPAFLKAVYAFGGQEDEPNDSGLAGFRCDSTSSQSYSYHADILQDRHESEDCLWYLVRSVERSGDSDTATRWSWRIRQAAVYHSFNSRTGRSFFLTIKGNTFREQIQEQASSLMFRVPAGESQIRQQVVAKALETALATHLMFLSWCTRPWGQFIEDSRSKVRPTLDRAGTIPVDQDIGVLAAGAEQGLLAGAPPHGAALKLFRFQDLQRLYNGHHNIHDAFLAMEEARRVMKGVRRYYEDKARTSWASSGGDRSIQRFASELRSFCGTLEAAKEQLKILCCKVGKGIELVSDSAGWPGICSRQLMCL